MTSINLLKEDTPFIIAYRPPTGTWIKQLRIPLIHYPTTSFNRSQLVLKIYFNGADIYRLAAFTGSSTNTRGIDYSTNVNFGYELATTSNGAQEALLTMTLLDPKPEDVGIYEVIFDIRTSVVGLQCCQNHRNFLLDTSGMSLREYVIGSATVDLKVSSM